MPAPERYSRLTVGLHWFMLLLIAAVYVSMEFRGYFPRGSATREAMKLWHYMLGLSVLALLVVRIGARFAAPTPPIVPAAPRWQELLAKLMHLALYLFMAAMPIAGWVILSAEGHAVPFFGLELPPLVGEDRALAESVEDLHKTIATVGYWLIGLHAVAALVHHHVQKDNTLRRMLPRRD